MEKVDTRDGTIKVCSEPAECQFESDELTTDAKVRAAMANDLGRLTGKHAQAMFAVMPLRDRLRTLSALNQIRESLTGALGRLSNGQSALVDDMESAEWFLNDIWDQNNWRIDALQKSVFATRPENDAERREWLSVVLAYIGQQEYDLDEIRIDMPELFDELQQLQDGGVSAIAELDKLAADYRNAIQHSQKPNLSDHHQWVDRVCDLEEALFAVRCSTQSELQHKATILSGIVEGRGNSEGDLGHFGLALLKSLLPPAAPTAFPATSTKPERKVLRGLSELEQAENRLLNCLDWVAVQQERGEDKDHNAEGYELLFKIQCDVGEVIADKQEARTVSEAMRPCHSIADVKDRVALLLAATWENMEEKAVADVYSAVRNSIVTFAREGGAQ